MPPQRYPIANLHLPAPESAMPVPTEAEGPDDILPIPNLQPPSSPSVPHQCPSADPNPNPISENQRQSAAHHRLFPRPCVHESDSIEGNTGSVTRKEFSRPGSIKETARFRYGLAGVNQKIDSLRALIDPPRA